MAYNSWQCLNHKTNFYLEYSYHTYTISLESPEQAKGILCVVFLQLHLHSKVVKINSYNLWSIRRGALWCPCRSILRSKIRVNIRTRYKLNGYEVTRPLHWINYSFYGESNFKQLICHSNNYLGHIYDSHQWTPLEKNMASSVFIKNIQNSI